LGGGKNIIEEFLHHEVYYSPKMSVIMGMHVHYCDLEVPATI
jgi:hypothetical protein